MTVPSNWTFALIAATSWAAFRVFVPLAIIANLAVALFPRARGIGFFPQIKYAIITAACLICAVGTAFLYRFLQSATGEPQRVLFLLLFAVALILLILTALLGPRKLWRAAAPAIFASALTLSLLVPHFAEHPTGRITAIVTVMLGTLEIVGVVAALASERVVSPNSDRLPFAVARAVFDAEHKFVDLPGGARIHYVDEGSGQTLLFLHGNPAWSFQWRDLIAGLRGSFRCIALDYPGFGLSLAPPGYGFTPREQSLVLEEFVDCLGLGDLTLVMQDWGGPIGLGFAGRRPELVSRLVLGNTWAWPTNTSEIRGKFSVIMGGPLGEFVQMNFNGFAKFALKQGVVRPLPKEVVEMYLRPFRPFDRRGVAAFYPGQITAASAYMSEVEAGLHRVKDRETLIFWGLRDVGFPASDLKRFEQAFPNHKTIELPEADHFFFEDAAPLMIKKILASHGA